MQTQSKESIEGKISTLENELREVTERINSSTGEARLKYIEEERKLLITGIRLLRELANC